MRSALSEHDSIHGHRNLNKTERSVIARCRNFNAPKICKITVFNIIVIATPDTIIHETKPGQDRDWGKIW